MCKMCKICSGLGTLERQNNTAREEEETEVENIVSRTSNIVLEILYWKYCLKDVKSQLIWSQGGEQHWLWLWGGRGRHRQRWKWSTVWEHSESVEKDCWGWKWWSWWASVWWGENWWKWWWASIRKHGGSNSREPVPKEAGTANKEVWLKVSHTDDSNSNSTNYQVCNYQVWATINRAIIKYKLLQGGKKRVSAPGGTDAGEAGIFAKCSSLFSISKIYQNIFFTFCL